MVGLSRNESKFAGLFYRRGRWYLQAPICVFPPINSAETSPFA